MLDVPRSATSFGVAALAASGTGDTWEALVCAALIVCSAPREGEVALELRTGAAVLCTAHLRSSTSYVCGWVMQARWHVGMRATVFSDP